MFAYICAYYVFTPWNPCRCSERHIFCMAPPHLCAEFPPPPAVRVTTRYVVLNTSADLVLEGRFRGSFYTHEWVYNEDDLTFLTGGTSLFVHGVQMTNVGQTFTIPAGSASLRVGYYGPRVSPTLTGSYIRPTTGNTVIVGYFGESHYSVATQCEDSLKNLSIPAWSKYSRSLYISSILPVHLYIIFYDCACIQ